MSTYSLSEVLRLVVIKIPGLEGPAGCCSCWGGDPAVWGSGIVGYCRDCCGGT